MEKPQKPQVAAQRAKLFLNGRSQAVRLPKEFRFDGVEVEIRRDGDEVILAPVRKRAWPRGYWERVQARAKNIAIEPLPPLPAGPERESLDD